MTISVNDKNRQTGSDLNNQDLPLGKTENGKLNGANGVSDIEGKVTRVGASEYGQRTSFKS
jgi:hypothetical protein